MTGTSISYDGNDLQTVNIQTSAILHEQFPEKYAPVYAIAHENASKIPFVDYPSKIIRINGMVVDSSVVSLDSRLDTFRSYFRNKDKNLDIGYAGATRRYVATATSISIDRPFGLGYATFEIEFTATVPFGQDTTNTTALSASGRTSAIYTDAHTFVGSAPVQLPIFTITYSGVSSTGTQAVTIGNAGNGQSITISRSTWATSDIITIDCLNKTVQVNGADTNFTGAFPEFPPGAQTMSYQDTFTSRTFNISTVYKALYL